MVNEEILGGLISALTRGEPLKKAMMSFYNAGYKKEEIEEAARALYSPANQPVSQPQAKPIPQVSSQKPIQKPEVKKLNPVQKVSQYGKVDEKKGYPISNLIKYQEQKKETKAPFVLQKTSDYKSSPPKIKGKVLTFILLAILVLLLGSLVALFFFKDDVIGILNNLNSG